MSTAHALYEQDGPLAVLTFNRPEARNAMTWEMYEAVVTACDAVEADASVRVLVLRGAGGKAFVSGTDISQFTSFGAPEDGIEYERRLRRRLGPTRGRGPADDCADRRICHWRWSGARGRV